LGTRWGANLITRLAFSVATSLLLANVSSAADVSDGPDMYVGAFGGVGLLDDTSMRQVGTVITPFFFPDINVDARGSADSVVAPIAGLQLGYEFNHWDVSASGWGVGMAAEIEGLYLGAEPKGVLDIDPQALGTQYVTLPVSVGAVLVNAVFNLRTPYSDAIAPYAGIGAGYGAVFINGSNSTNPSEPGINHFNSEPDASSGGLALQAKIGIRAAVTSNWSVFTEYRHVYITSTDYTFGQTDYPGEHLPTTKWNVELGQQNYNLWVSGLSYRF
jgi:opacity protein-like surface antigen